MKSQTFSIDDYRAGRVHFIGIGGVSMSGLAQILRFRGFQVSGSDMKSSGTTDRLSSEGIAICIGHCEENIDGAVLVVHTAAVKADNPEMQRAAALGIPTIERAVLLGALMSQYPDSVAVSGTHGKTTTTSMLSAMLLEADLDPTLHIGAEFCAIGGNTRIGGNRYFVAEACEYVGSFLNFHPRIALLLNIELDHVDYFKSLEDMKQTFVRFLGNVHPEGVVIACVDDANVRDAITGCNRHVISYGLESPDAFYSARKILPSGNGGLSFQLHIGGQYAGTFEVGVPGRHNVSNALAALAAADYLGADRTATGRALAAFTGACKRFERKGKREGVTVIDDYAHHPSEIRATLAAARTVIHTPIWCVFQPHTYTRTRAFLDDFAASFGDVDKVIVSDIYAAREKDPGDIHASMLADRIAALGGKACYVKGFESIVDTLVQDMPKNATLITMGAGDVVKVGEMFLKRD